ncbi:maleate cis-trans isomerase family protein [Micromonospora sp. WMMA1923]|uniref:maleate cis-trans isomerase family protein n=1 Tax=Micromonospora sp. WMMA1923 TaxID=3404125 RepID=UPI003B930752
MTTSLARRAVFGVIVPSTNTVVEDEYNLMRPPGISVHTGRIHMRNESLAGDDRFEEFLAELRTELGAAIDRVMTAKPDGMIMGMSAETFWGGVEGSGKFTAWVRERCGLTPATGAAACAAALTALGVRRIGVITPYQPVGDVQVREFFEGLGFEVDQVLGLKCPTATSIAEVPLAEVERAFLAVDGPRVDALVQAGTNLPAVAVAADLETRLGKPVLAINAATFWYALRQAGFTDRITGFGRLLEQL